MKDAGFTLGMIALAIVISLGAWFGLISPTFTAKSEAEAAAEEAREFNMLLETQLLQKRAEAQKLPELEATLAGIQEELPRQDLLAEVRRDLNATFAEYGVAITSDSLVKPSLVVPGSLSHAGVAAASGRPSYYDGLNFQDLYSATIDLRLEATPGGIIRAISDLQMDQERYYLVEGFQSLTDPDESGVRGYAIRVTYFILVDHTSDVDPGATSDDVRVPTDVKLGPIFVEVPAAE